MERVCPRCTRVCFSEEEWANHPCFDMAAKLDAEISQCVPFPEVAFLSRPHAYILIGQTPVPEPDVLKWADWFETADRVVFRTEMASALISTVFLGLDHRHFGDGPPILFETMIFSDGGEVVDMWRCSTWLEAEAQHQRAVEEWEKRIRRMRK